MTLNAKTATHALNRWPWNAKTRRHEAVAVDAQGQPSAHLCGDDSGRSSIYGRPEVTCDDCLGVAADRRLPLGWIEE